MSFQFSLTAVLLIRREREASRERALAAAERELHAVRQQLEMVDDELRRLAGLRESAEPCLMQGVAVQEQYARWAVLQQARTELKRAIAERAIERDAQMRLYLSARRDRELLEKLETEQRATYYAAATMREQKLSDELFLLRRPRR